MREEEYPRADGPGVFVMPDGDRNVILTSFKE